VVAAILRLSKKYQIDYLRDDAIRRLTFEYPSTLKGREACVSKPWSRVGWCKGCTIDVINLARETGIHSVLPFAFWVLVAQSQTNYILEGRRRDDGTLAILSWADQKMCLLATDRVRVAHANDMFGWLGEVSPRCRTPHGCAKIRNGHLVRLWRPPSAALSLFGWKASDWKKGLCDACADIGKKAYKEGRLLLWNKLPSLFGLPEWEELRSQEPDVSGKFEVCLQPVLLMFILALIRLHTNSQTLFPPTPTPTPPTEAVIPPSSIFHP